MYLYYWFYIKTKQYSVCVCCGTLYITVDVAVILARSFENGCSLWWWNSWLIRIYMLICVLNLHFAVSAQWMHEDYLCIILSFCPIDSLGIEGSKKHWQSIFSIFSSIITWGMKIWKLIKKVLGQNFPSTVSTANSV